MAFGKLTVVLFSLKILHPLFCITKKIHWQFPKLDAMANVIEARFSSQNDRIQCLENRFEEKLENFMRQFTIERAAYNNQVNAMVQESVYLRNEMKILHQKINNLEISAAKSKKNHLGYQIAKEISSIVGLKELIIAKDKFLKWVWAFVLLIGIALTIYFVCQTAIEYFANPVATRVELVPYKDYKYPPIIFCPNAWLDADKASSIGLSLDALKYSFGYYDQGVDPSQLQNITTAKEEFLRFYRANNFSSLNEYFTKIAIDIALVTEYTDIAQPIPAALCPDCSEKLTKIFFDGGVCYLFKLNDASGEYAWRNLGTKEIGNRQLITLKIPDRTRNLIPTGPFWRMYVTQNAELPLQYSTSGMLFLPTGTANVVRLSVERVIKLKNYGTFCLNEKDVDKNYSSKTCYQKCTSLVNRQNLQCWDFTEMVDNSTINFQASDYCNYLDRPNYPNFWSRQSQSQQLSNSPQMQIQIQNCVLACPQKCDRLSYDLTMRSQIDVSDLPPYEKILADTATQANMSIVAIGIEHQAVYEGGISTLSEINTISFTSLVSNIGGALGLFVGGTMMTLIQVILFLVKRVKEKGAKKIIPVVNREMIYDLRGGY